MKRFLSSVSKICFVAAGLFAGAHIFGLGANAVGSRPSKWNLDNITIKDLEKEAKAFEESLSSRQLSLTRSSVPALNNTNANRETSATTDLPANIQEDMKRDALAGGFYRASVKTTLYPDNKGNLRPILTFAAGDCMKIHGAPSSTGFIAASVQPWASEPATNGWVRRSDLESQPTLDCK